MSVGIMLNISSPSNFEKIYKYISIFKEENIDVFYFTNDTIFTSDNKIKGFTYNKGKLIEDYFSYPDVVLNLSCEVLPKLIKDIREIKRFVEREYSVYKILIDNDVVTNNINPTYIVEDIDYFYKLIHRYNKVLINNNYYIEQVDDKFLIKNNKEEVLYDKYKFNRFLNLKLLNTFVLKRYIESKIDDKLFDVIVNIEKIGVNKFEIVNMYVRESNDRLFINKFDKINIKDVFNDDEVSDIKKISMNIINDVSKLEEIDGIDFDLVMLVSNNDIYLNQLIVKNDVFDTHNSKKIHALAKYIKSIK